MSKVISINDSAEENGATFYKINIKIPLRNLQVRRRYSEFEELVKQLCSALGIDSRDFPYSLPPKSSIFTKNSPHTVQERKLGLEQFLNFLVSDRELQNLAPLHEFLQLPIKFQFTSSIIKNGNGGINDLVISDPSSINPSNWLELLRLFKSHMNQLMEIFNNDPSINTKLDIRTKVHLVVAPNLDKLINRLDQMYKNRSIPENEYQRRKLLAKELSHEVEALHEIIESKKHPVDENPKRSLMGSRRVLGAQPQETKDTLPLSNKELLQQQIQIHRDQDQELDELRKIIARQRDIGLTINQEVEEQNELLDELNGQVDHASDKLRDARRRAKKIL